MSEEKITRFKKYKQERNQKIIERYKQLREEGYMKSTAYETIREEVGFYSVQGIAVIIRKAVKEGLIEDRKKTNEPQEK